jgi:hypothetical protein
VLPLFQGNRAGVLLLLPVLCGVYVFLNIRTGYYQPETSCHLGLWGDVAFSFSFTPIILSTCLICFNAFSINWIYNQNEFFERNTYTSSLLYVVLMSFYHSFYGLDGLLISHTFVIGMLYQLFKLRQNEDGRKAAFNAAFCAGVAASFHPSLVAILPFVWIMVWALRPFNFREFILVLTGFAIPILYGMIMFWYSRHNLEMKILEQTSDYIKKQTDFLITATLFSILFLISIISIRIRMKKSSSRLRNLVRILWWLVFIGIIFGTVDYIIFGQIERFSLLMIPLSFFLTFAFNRMGSKQFDVVATTLFYLTFAYSLINFFL